MKYRYIAHYRHQTRLQLMQIAFALELHFREQGKFPENLEHLQPSFKPEQLIDLFIEEPLIYKPTDNGYLLYSVGENWQDDGGVSFNDEPPGDDIVINRIVK